MADFSVTALEPSQQNFPRVLRTIPDPPKRLWAAGDVAELCARPRVTIVGSRKVSPYGRAITQKLAGELARSGVVVVSGLALGVDSLAHKAALEAGGLTAAILPGSLAEIYPRTHVNLAKQIVQSGGALLTEYEVGERIFPINFIARNRLVAGLGDVVLVTEAAAKSGTLHTARFALGQGKDVLAVPGDITSPTSVGTNQLIKSGAGIVTCVQDIFDALGIEPTKQKAAAHSDNPQEQAILDLLSDGVIDANELLARTGLGVQQFNQALTMLEITGAIRPLGNNQWALH